MKLSAFVAGFAIGAIAAIAYSVKGNKRRKQQLISILGCDNGEYDESKFFEFVDKFIETIRGEKKEDDDYDMKLAVYAFDYGIPTPEQMKERYPSNSLCINYNPRPIEEKDQ